MAPSVPFSWRATIASPWPLVKIEVEAVLDRTSRASYAAAVILSVTNAWAGHAGESGVVPAMPHEILGALSLLAGLGIALVIIGLVIIKLLVSIERHLRKLP